MLPFKYALPDDDLYYTCATYPYRRLKAEHTADPNGAHIKMFSSEMVATYVYARKKKGLDLMFTVDETEEKQKIIMRERYEQRKQLLLLQQQLYKTDCKDEDAKNSEEIKEWLDGLHLRSREEPSTLTSENGQAPMTAISARKGSINSTGVRFKNRIKTMPLKQGASGRRKSEIFPSSNLSMVPSSPTILITDFSPFTTEEAPVQVPIPKEKQSETQFSQRSRSRSPTISFRYKMSTVTGSRNNKSTRSNSTGPPTNKISIDDLLKLKKRQFNAPLPNRTCRTSNLL